MYEAICFLFGVGGERVRSAGKTMAGWGGLARLAGWDGLVLLGHGIVINNNASVTVKSYYQLLETSWCAQLPCARPQPTT